MRGETSREIDQNTSSHRTYLLEEIFELGVKERQELMYSVFIHFHDDVMVTFPHKVSISMDQLK